MSFAETFATFPNSVLGWLTIAVAVIFAMYMMRVPAHRAILSLSRSLYKVLRISAASLMQAEARMKERNREVLLAAGLEEAESHLEREFERIDAAVKRELSGCPSVHRRMAEQITHVEEDHQESTNVPPAPPGWIDAVEAVANIPSKGDPMVANILEQIHKSLVKAQDDAIDTYRDTVQERHKTLSAMKPYWRDLHQSMGVVEKKVDSLLARTNIIDTKIEQYETIKKGTDTAVRRLSASSLKEFMIALFALCIAIGGAGVNFTLIARPLAEMVGGNNLVGGFKINDIAAMVIILIEIFMGLFLMESLRITRLFPLIGALPDKFRRLMTYVTFTLLFSLATIEAALAYMREILLQDELATSAVLRGGDALDTVATNEFVWITTVAQMGMGFILPFALTLVAIPLEMFFASSRTVVGMVAAAGVRGLAVSLRAVGGSFRFLGEFLVNVYDAFCAPPLWIERMVKANIGAERKARSAKAPNATVREAL